MSAQFTAQEFRIVLVGKTGVGKSASGNTILGGDYFHNEASSKSVTKQCSLASAAIEGNIVTVVDTPGLCDTDLSEAEITQAIVKCVDMSYPGPHVFLLVLSIGRFTAEEKQTVEKIQEIFGEGAARYTMILFTRGDDLEDKSIDDYLKEATADHKALIKKCNGRYHVFYNKEKNNDSQVSNLLKKIKRMVRENGGGCYTNTMYQLLENYKKREAELQQKAEAARREMKAREAEIQRLIRAMDEQNKNIVSMMEQMKLENQRKHEEEKRQNLLSAQAAEHQRMVDREQQKWREQQLEREHSIERMKMKRQHEEARHRERMERQTIEREKLEITRNYEKMLYKLEQEKREIEDEKKEMLEKQTKRKHCVIS